MNPILFTAAKGAERAMLAQEVRANNLANVNTVGFKMLLENSQHMKIGGSGFESSVTARTNSASNNFKAGGDIVTNRPLDTQIIDTGFFAVQGNENEAGELYTRDGSFKIDQDGNLMLGKRSVVDAGGQPINIPEYQEISIDSDGIISIIPPGGGANIEVAELKLVKPENFEMTLDSTGLFVAKNGEPLPADDTVEVRSGYLEASNVSSLEELVSIMSLQRQYEMQVKAMAAASEIEQMGNQLLKG